MDPFIINNYSQLLGKSLDELNLRDKPHLIWNLDESSFCTDPSKTKVVGSKGIAESNHDSQTEQPSVSYPSKTISFEELLLYAVKQHKSTEIKKNLKRKLRAVRR